MADNVTVTAGSYNSTVATDNIGGVDYQRVKLSLGADGTANDMIPVAAGMDSASAGILAAGLVGQLDDVGTTTVTENQFAPVRISSRRALLVEGVASGQPVVGNLTQLGGTAIDTNSGNKSGGTLRVVIATDQPALTNNLPTNIAQMNGVTVTMGNGVSGTGVQRVTLASDSTGQVAVASLPSVAVRTAYGSDTTPTCTINSLASSATAGRASAAADFSSTKYLDAMARLTIKMPGAGSPANDKAVYLYAAGSVDAGTTYSDGVTAGDAAFTHTDPPNLRLVGVVNCPANTNSYVGGPWSVAQAFGGVLPDHVVFVVRNYTGLTLDSSGNTLHYTPVYATEA